MDITFRKSKLKKLANNFKTCQKELGKIRSKLFHLRLGDLRNAQTLNDVRHLPGRYHELTGDRKGSWACDLDQPYRLIFVPHVQPIPTNDSGASEWALITGVEVLEIVNYHD